MAARASFLALCAVCLLSFFWNLGGNGLFDLDEALYAECAREMALTGDYVIPHVNREPFYEKPPLVYWAGAASFRLFGRKELTARLPSALASLCVVMLVLRFGSKHFGKRAGYLAAFFFALSPMVFGAARQLTTDATLDLCIALSLLGYFQGRTSESRSGKLWHLLFWAGMGLGVLAKGLPGILIPIATVVVFHLFHRIQPKPAIPLPKAVRLRRRVESASNKLSDDAEPNSGESADDGGRQRRRSRCGPWIFFFGLIIFLAIALPWHLLAYRDAGRAFIDEYIIRQHVGRFRGGDVSHLAPFWFFIPGFLVGAFPWSFFVPTAMLSRIYAEDGPIAADLRTFLKIWAVLVFLMFSASGSKLISYILPMYPPAALLAGDWCARVLDKERPRRALLWCGALAFILSAALLMVIVYSAPIIREIERATHRPVRLDQIPLGALRWAGHLFGATTCATGGFFLLTAVNRRKAAFGAMALGMTAFFAFAVFEGLPLIDRALLRPLHEIARSLNDRFNMPYDTLIVKTGGARRPSVLFYLPDRLIAKSSSSEGVIETRSTEEFTTLMLERFPCLALIDRGSDAAVRQQTGALIWLQNDFWVVLGPVRMN